MWWPLIIHATLYCTVPQGSKINLITLRELDKAVLIEQSILINICSTVVSRVREMPDCKPGHLLHHSLFPKLVGIIVRIVHEDLSIKLIARDRINHLLLIELAVWALTTDDSAIGECSFWCTSLQINAYHMIAAEKGATIECFRHGWPIKAEKVTDIHKVLHIWGDFFSYSRVKLGYLFDCTRLHFIL